MASRHPWRAVPGLVAFLLAVGIATAAPVIALYSFFHEGWGQGAGTAAVPNRGLLVRT